MNLALWKWISCSNDIMNHNDCIIKHDVYPHKMHSCSKNICGIIKKKYIIGMGIPLVER